MKKIVALSSMLFAAFVFAGCNDHGGGGNSADETTNTTSTATSSTDNSSNSSDNSNDNSGSSSTSTSSSTSQNYNLTGKWVLSGKTGVYRLQQNGRSVQGLYRDAVNNDVSGSIAGSVSGTRVELDVIVEFASDPTQNFTAHKSGTILSENRMELYVTAGPTQYFGHRQLWLRM